MKVFVTRPVFDEAIDRLRRVFEVELNTEERILPKQELIALLGDKDGALALLTDAIDFEVLESTPRLKAVANFAVGFNNVAVDSATKLGVVITNTPGVLTDTTADFAWTLLMAAGRRLVEADKYCRAGKYEGWGPMLFLGHDIRHKTLGIVGMGRIGQAVARRAHGFEMKILYTDEFRLPPEKEQELRATFVSLEQLLKESDFVSLHVPLMASTKHLVGKKQLEMMKKTAVLVNTSRGPVVDERALVEALKNQTIFAAGLDVYEEEPRLAPGLADLDNVTIPPHIASASIDTRAKMATMAASNIIAFFKGEKPPNIVNPEVLS